MAVSGHMDDEQAAPPQAELIKGGYWDGDGNFHSPEGWDEGVGWRVLNADGTVAQQGPATDLHMVLSTNAGQGPLPDADLGVAFVGTPAEEPGE